MGTPFPTGFPRIEHPAARRRAERGGGAAGRNAAPPGGRSRRQAGTAEPRLRSAGGSPAAGPPYRYLAAASTLSLSYTENGPMSTRSPFSRVGSLWMV